jgi:Fe-S cluster biogenesis protein NfuA/Fe-S cluster assembly iron-binding protein IscA
LALRTVSDMDTLQMRQASDRSEEDGFELNGRLNDLAGGTLTCTKAAAQWLHEHLESQTLVVRVGVENGQYVYDLEAVEAETVEDELVEYIVEYVVEDVADLAVRIAVSLDSRRHLYGAVIDVRDGGLVVRNPNKPAPFTNPELCNDDELAEQVARLLAVVINPELARHGGRAWMLGHENRRAHIVLGGGCSGCSMADATMFSGIERIVVARVDGIDAVIDDTQHELGQEPYYR